MIVIAGYLITDTLDFLYVKAVSWLAGNSELGQSLGFRIYLVVWRSYCLSPFISITKYYLKPRLGPAVAGISPVSIERSKQE